MTTSFPRVALAAGLLTSTAIAQDITTLVAEGDAVPGVGAVTSIDAIWVNDLGEWLVEADTNNADTTQDGVVLKNGALFAREGEALAAPAGTSIGSFDSVQMNDAGDLGWNLFLDGASTGTDSGFFLNKTLLFQEGDAPAVAGLSAGSAFQGFFDAKIDSAGTSLLLATVDDPAITSSVDQALILVSGTSPGTVAMTVVAKEGDVLPGQSESIATFQTGPHDFAYTDTGRVMFIADLTGDTSFDGAVYLDSTLIAQEGSPSPVAGRTWSTLSSGVVDVNDAGHYVFTGSLDGDTASNALIVKDGAKFRQEGDSLAAIAPFAFTSFGSGPVWISNAGEVLWYGDWNDPDTDVDTGLFLDDELLIQEGVTQIEGAVVDTLRGVQDGYRLSTDGRYVIAEVELEGGIQTAILIDLGYGTITPMSDCTSPAGSLTWTAGAPVLGGSFELTLDNAQGAGVFPFVGFATQPVPGYPPCGLVVPGIGELLIDFLPPNPVLILPGAQTTGAPTAIGVPVGVDTTLLGAQFFVQGLFADVLGLTPEPFRVTNGLVVIVGS